MGLSKVTSMWFAKLLALSFPAIALGLNQLDVSSDFPVNYFKARNVPFICLITCGNMLWDLKFTKAASAHSMFVSRLDIDNVSNGNTKQCFRQVHTTIGVLMNTLCENAEQILNAASENMWLDSMHIWLIVDETEDLVDSYKNISTGAVNYEDSEYSLKTFQILNKLNISIDADIVLALKNGDQFTLFDVFNFGKEQGGSLMVVEAALWTNKSTYKGVVELNRYKYYRRWDFKFSALRIISVATSATKNFDPKLLTEIRPVPDVSTITRTTTMPFMILSEVHNIRFIHTITDRWVGTFDRNVSRASASALYFREQDLTSVLRFQKQLLGRISLINPALTSLETRYYYRIPTTGPGKFENQFLRPLSTGAWWCLAGVSALCGILLLFSARFETRPSSAQYAIFSIMASVCQQFFEDDSLTSRVSAARKLTVFVTGVFCVLVYNYYTSSVVSWLLSAPPPSINSLRELLESPLELIYQDVGYTRTWLNTPGYYYNRRNAKDEDAIRNQVLSKKRTTPVIKPVEEGIALVKAGASTRVSSVHKTSSEAVDSPCTSTHESSMKSTSNNLGGIIAKYISTSTYFIENNEIQKPNSHGDKHSAKGYAYHTDTCSANTLISQTFEQSELCELGSLASMEKTLLYPGLQKDSPYKEFLTWRLIRLLETGVVSSIQRRTTPRAASCMGSSPRALALGGAAPAFILLAFGFFLGTSIMLVERVIYNLRQGSILKNAATAFVQ